MVIYAVLKCGNRSGRDKGKRVFRLPSIITHQGEKALELSRQRQLQWLARIKRKDLRPEKYPITRVCSDHFVSGSPSTLFDESNPDWAPSLNLGYDSESMNSTSMKAKTGRYERAVERAKKRTIDEVEQEESDVDIPATDESISVSTQTDMSMEDFQIQLEVMREENKILSETL